MFKVTSQKIKPDFQPVSITIEVKDERMFSILASFCSMDLTIPQLLVERGLIKEENEDTISRLLTSIHTKLLEAR